MEGSAPRKGGWPFFSCFLIGQFANGIIRHKGKKTGDKKMDNIEMLKAIVADENVIFASVVIGFYLSMIPRLLETMRGTSGAVIMDMRKKKY